MSVSKDLVIDMINQYWSQMKSRNQYSVSGTVSFATAGQVAMSNTSTDFFKMGDASGSFVFTGDFSISASDTLTSIYFKVVGGYGNYFQYEYQITGSYSLSPGSYVVVARVDYVIQSVTVTAP